jgi:V/A-type H+-transporting ATPase subunit K
MTILFYAIAVFVVILTPSVLHFGFKLSGKKMKTVLGLNVFSFAALLMAAIVIMLGDSGVLAQEAGQASDGATSMGYLAAALVTGLASIGAGIAVAASASAAIGAISEDASVMGKALIFVALAEGIALYGLLISFTILSSL